MSCSFAGICFTALILIFEVTPQPEFSFTCPDKWTDGAVENMKCVIPQAKFSAKSSGGLCDTYVDSVVFRLTTPDGTKSAPCTVTGIDTTCDGSANAAGCGCREKSGGDVIIDYNITAVKADHEGAHWECEPQCYDAAGNPPVLSPPNTTECFNTIFGTSVTSAPGCPICKKGTDCDKPDWICLLFLLLLIPIVILIIILWYFFVHKPKTGDNCGNKKAEEGGQKGSPKNQQTSNGTNPADGKGSPQNQQTTNGNRTVDGKRSPQNQQTTNGNRTADGKRSGQRDNKVGTGHVATNGAHNGEKVSKPVQETELTKVQETSSAPSGVEETSLNGSVRPLPMPNVTVAAPSPRLPPPFHSSTPMTSVERNSQVLEVPHNPRPLPLPGINKSTKM